MQTTNTQVNPAAQTQGLAQQPTPTDRATALELLLQGMPPVPMATPGQRKAADAPAGSNPGMHTNGSSGSQASGNLWAYPQSHNTNGRAYLGSFAQAFNAVLACAKAEKPLTHKNVAGMGSSAFWYGSRTALSPLLGYMANVPNPNNPRQVACTATPKGLAWLAMCADASKHYKTAAWACQLDNVALDMATGAVLGPWPLAATDAPKHSTVGSNAYGAALAATTPAGWASVGTDTPGGNLEPAPKAAKAAPKPGKTAQQKAAAKAKAKLEPKA